jgi:hypothetical protein
MISFQKISQSDEGVKAVLRQIKAARFDCVANMDLRRLLPIWDLSCSMSPPSSGDALRQHGVKPSIPITRELSICAS